ncbi:MAG: hypothetical protein M1814_006172 [Vezdaea aestivalis]|nr:MAG: hypothetical protein M1814_006172 [Vezdaea aestivalis]
MSASPASSTPAAGAIENADQAQKNLEQITFRFCRECSNMLYPKEDKEQNKLMFACRTCQFSEEATSSCIFRNVMSSSVGETAGVTQDVGSDPTVSLSVINQGLRSHGLCTLCGDAHFEDSCPLIDCREGVESQSDELDSAYGSAED